MPEPTTYFPVLAQLPLFAAPPDRKFHREPEPPRPTREPKRSKKIPIAASVRIRIRMRFIINNLEFLNRESQISQIPIA
jgi:hypothetical protein